jgi:virulence-associated protein VagC
VIRADEGQFVPLPEEVAFPPGVRAVEVRVEGNNARVLVPVDTDWDTFFAAPGVDFPDRDQPPTAEERAPLEPRAAAPTKTTPIPGRPGSQAD